MQVTLAKVCSIVSLIVSLVLPAALLSQDVADPAVQPLLVKAVMCESIQKFSPANEAVVFSINIGRVICFSEFDPVPTQTIIYHKWYHKGGLVSVKQLTVNPPRWSSFSSMQLRYADKGPWQVEVVDKNDRLLQTLRFSITD